jgi:hypothetical protein
MWHVSEKREIMQDFGVGHRSELLDRRRCRWEDDAEIDSSGSGWGRVASWCEYRDEPSGFKKCGEFLG